MITTNVLLAVIMLLVSTRTVAEPISVRSVSELKMSGIERQTKDYSCGAAALSVLLKLYFDDDIEEIDILSDIVHRLNKKETIESMLKGFSMYDLKLAAERLGYSAVGVKLNVKSASALAGPVILLLKNDKFSHFVVLKGITQGKAFIVDPAKGHYRVQMYELLKKWRGEALIVGRDGFGLPKLHGLNHPLGSAVAPEQYTVRALQHTPLN